MSKVGDQVGRLCSALSGTTGDVALALETRRLTASRAASWRRSLELAVEEAAKLEKMLDELS